jgi:hypothetical protein
MGGGGNKTSKLLFDPAGPAAVKIGLYTMKEKFLAWEETDEAATHSEEAEKQKAAFTTILLSHSSFSSTNAACPNKPRLYLFTEVPCDGYCCFTNYYSVQ